LPAQSNAGPGGNASDILAAYSNLKVALPGTPCDLADHLRDGLDDCSNLLKYCALSKRSTTRRSSTKVYLEASPLHDQMWGALLGFIGDVGGASPVIAVDEGHHPRGQGHLRLRLRRRRRPQGLTLCAAPAASAAPVDAAIDAKGSVVHGEKCRPGAPRRASTKSGGACSNPNLHDPQAAGPGRKRRRRGACDLGKAARLVESRAF